MLAFASNAKCDQCSVNHPVGTADKVCAAFAFSVAAVKQEPVHTLAGGSGVNLYGHAASVSEKGSTHRILRSSVKREVRRVVGWPALAKQRKWAGTKMIRSGACIHLTSTGSCAVQATWAYSVGDVRYSPVSPHIVHTPTRQELRTRMLRDVAASVSKRGTADAKRERPSRSPQTHLQTAPLKRQRPLQTSLSELRNTRPSQELEDSGLDTACTVAETSNGTCHLVTLRSSVFTVAASTFAANGWGKKRRCCLSPLAHVQAETFKFVSVPSTVMRMHCVAQDAY